jgi:hypothetical protein
MAKLEDNDVALLAGLYTESRRWRQARQ